MSWTEIESDPTFQSLTIDSKERIKNNYFEKEIAPKVPTSDMDKVRSSFFEGSRLSDKEKITNDGVSAIGSLLKRAVDSNIPGLGVLWDQYQKGLQVAQEGAKIGSHLLTAQPVEQPNLLEGMMGELRKIPVPGAETLNKGIKESAGGIAEGVSESLARSGHEKIAVPAGVAESIASGPGLAYLANPEVKNLADIAQIAAADQLFTVLADVPSPNIPPARYAYNWIKYKLGLPVETSLVTAQEQVLREGIAKGTVTLADAMRASPVIFKEELNKRGLTPNQIKSRPPITPEETANSVIYAEDLSPGASRSAQLAPRTFMSSTSVSEVPPGSSARVGAFQGQINQILGLKPGTPITPESYHKAMETGKLNRIEALEIDEQIFKAEATKEGIKDQSQAQLYQHSKVTAQKPVEFKILKDLAQKAQNELNPSTLPEDPQKVPDFHEMTKDQFQVESARISKGNISSEMASQIHQNIIEQAIGEGKDVPKEVVSSYAQEIKPKAKKSQWSPEPGGWKVEKGDRPGVQMSRGDDLVIKTASGKFKAFKEDNLIGEFSTSEKAAQAIEGIDDDEANIREKEGKDLQRVNSPTPALDFARKKGLSRAKIIEGDYYGEADNLKGKGVVKTRGGVSPDEMAELMKQEGIIPEHDLNMMWDILDKEARLGKKADIKIGGGVGSFASKGLFTNVEPEPADVELPVKKAMPLEMPELVKLSKQLIGKYPDISNRMGPNTRGLFTGGKIPNIKLRPDLFQDTDQVSKVLAHEIGHANDFFPEETMSRGNLIGRIMSFKKYMKQTFGGDLETNIPGLKYTNKELKYELISLSEFWRPYNKDSVEKSFIKYRESADELYADALSVFLNSPGTLQKLAPKFFDALMDNLDRKPEFKEEWLNIQDLLNGSREEVLKSRREDIRQMGMKSEEIIIRKKLEKAQQIQSTGDQLKQALLDRYYPILKEANNYEAKGNKIPDHLNPKYVFQEGDMVGNEYALMDMQLDSVLNPLRRKYGIGPIELHEYGFANRILHDRSGLANPLGIDAKSAQENLDYLKRSLGDEAFNALKDAFDKTQEIFWPVIEEADRLGVISHNLFVSTIIPNKGNYVSFAVLDYLEKTGYISAGISEQTGTLKEIGNTWLSTRMKSQAMMYRNADQRNKLSFKNIWDLQHPGELTKTKISRVGPGPGIEKTEPGKEVIYIYEDGKRVAYDVDPYIARAFERWKPGQTDLVLKALNLVNFPFKMMYTMENAGFVFFTSPIRYFEKTYKGLSGTKGEGIIPLLANYMVSLPASFSKAVGSPNDFVKQLIKDKVLDVSMEDLELEPELNSYRVKAKKYELEQKSPSDNGLMKRVGNALLYPFQKLLHGMQIAADTSTGAWKIAAAKIRLKAGESGPEMAYNVRNYAGVPNPRVKGTMARTTNSVFLFGNILQRHLATAYQILINPTTKGGARFKTVAMDVVPAIYQTLATLGILGYGMKEFYERFSKYERRHYTLLPLGSVKGGEYGWKAMAMPIPHDDAGRIIHAMTTEILTAMFNHKPKEFQSMLGELWSTLPGITPAIDIPVAWLQEYTTGRAVDTFRQRFIIPDNVEKIGGLLKLEKMVEWTMNETGLTNFQNYNPANRTTTEVEIQSTPLVNRMIKISDYGKTEKFKEEMDEFPLAEEAYRLKQKKKEGPLSREDTLRLQTLQYQAREYRAKIKREKKQ